MSNNNTASRAEPITAQQLMNLKRYGFLNVEIASEPREDGNVVCSYGKDDRPDLDYVKCTQSQADDLAEHLKKIGWSGSQ